MERKKISLNEISVIKECEELDNNQLSNIIGGVAIALSEEKCECNCIGGNCNDKTKK